MVTSKRVGLIVLGLLVVASLVATLIWVPKVEVYGLYQVLHPQKISAAFYKRDVFTQEDRARQTLATIVGGFLVLVGAYMTWRNLRATEKNAEIAEDKQITDRFTAAVTNLSAEDKMAQRLGGIYALERIARDSPKDHWTVMEVLTAYVRDKCPRNEIAEIEAKLDAAEAERQNNRVLPTDIQAILTVIMRRAADQDKGRKLDLHQVDLFRANLAEADLMKANLAGAYLARAKLMGADLAEANLAGADLAQANLMGADLMKANLTEANLVGAYLIRANLVGAYLIKADLTEANLAGTDLIKSSLIKSSLMRANLMRADLMEANLMGADLMEADLTGANLAGANLQKAYLMEANLTEAEMAACLNLTQQQLDSANQEFVPASLPPGLHFPAQAAPEPSPSPILEVPPAPPA